MNYRFFHRLLALTTVLVSFSTGCMAYEKLEYEHLTSTEITPWLSSYHITLTSEVENGIKGGETKQRAVDYAISPSNPDIHMFSNDIVGLYRSTDAGKSWKMSSNGINSYCNMDIVFHPEDENLVMAVSAVGSKYVSRIVSNGMKNVGIRVSRDCGETWLPSIAMPFEFGYGRTLLAVGSQKDKQGRYPVFLATNFLVNGIEAGVYRSYDWGETWTNVLPQNIKFRGIRCDVNSPYIVAFGPDGEIWCSYNNGDSWTDLRANLPDGAKIRALAIDPADEKHWIAGSGLKFMESFDAGKAWTAFSPEAMPNDYYKVPTVTKLSASGSIEIMEFGLPDKNGKARLYLSFNTMNHPFRYSDDYGRTLYVPNMMEGLAADSEGGWLSRPTVPHPTEYGTVVHCFPYVNISYNNEEIYRKSSSGVSGCIVNDIGFDKNGNPLYFVGTDNPPAIVDTSYEGLYKPFTKRFGSTEMPKFGASVTTKVVLVDPDDPKHCIFEIGKNNSPGMMAVTYDGFETSYHCPDVKNLYYENLDKYGKSYLVEKAFTHPQKPRLIYANKYRSYDFGESWEILDNPVYACAQNNGDRVYSVVSNYLYLSNDRGDNWINTGISMDGCFFRQNCFFVDAEDENVVWSASDKILRIDLNTSEKTMITSANGLIEIDRQVLWQNPNDKNHLITGGRNAADGGPYFVQESWDGGKSWHSIEGFSNMMSVSQIIYNQKKDVLYLSGPSGTYIYDYALYRKEMMKE